MANITILGLVAAFFTTCAGFPQIYRILQTRETKDISILTYCMVSFGILCWLIYGILIKDTPLIAANAVSLVSNLTILSFKIRYG